ncbi:MAG: hypothetical protein ACD_15C00217G0006 [uncultured bacterium]|nr:MAG: hypothetical protein ACD_15C00217G0006 [uncultured bacterium]
MSVLINFKICDNAKDCNGIAVCPTGALAWDAKKKSIKIDNEKCVSCRKCEKKCMVDAIHVARNEKEYEKIKKEIDEDPRKIGDLFVDRYGAEPIGLAFIGSEEKFQKEIIDYKKPAIVEFFDNDSVRCLLRSIPLRELIGKFNCRFRKVKIEKDLAENYRIKELPALLFFEKGKLIGKIEGYYDNEKKDELAKRIKAIIKK